MVKGKLKILFRPDKLIVSKILNSLEEHGFCNNQLQPHDYKKIRKAVTQSKFIALFFEDEPIGFTTWESEGNWVIIHYKWILPNFRGRKLGKAYAEMIYSEMLKRGKYLVLVEPATENGNYMASAFKFEPLANTAYQYSTNYQYKFLKSGRPHSFPSGEGWQLLIWKDHNYTTENFNCYELDDSMASDPIIAIVNCDASMEIRHNGSLKKRATCKDFFKLPEELQLYGLLVFKTNLSDLFVFKTEESQSENPEI